MSGKALAVGMIAALCAVSPAFAAGVSITVDDTKGRPAAGAIVELVSDTHADLPASRVPAEAIIDQRRETFIPLVSLVRKGGQVVFTNNDATMHQVYSFSPIKQFQFEIDQGERSKPVVFGQSGVASIGCNIHDQMIAYVYVADSPFAAMTDTKGYVTFQDVPAGAYHAAVWHPQAMPGRPFAPQPVAVANSPVALTLQIPLVPGAAPGTRPMHMGRY